MPGTASWSGTLFVGEGWIVYAGPLGPTELHAHHAVQIVASTGGVAVLDNQRRRFEAPTLVVPANVGHSLLADGHDGVVGYLDPLVVRLSNPTIQTWRNLMPSPGQLESSAHARGWAELTCSEFGASPRPAATEVVVAMIDEVRRRLPGSIRLGEVAAVVGFAPSTLTHRFTTELGVPFRRWVLWERLQLAAEAVRVGDNLTSAAHAAGFADSAHLNRTFRRMFGITPSEVVGSVRWETVGRPERSSD